MGDPDASPWPKSEGNPTQIPLAGEVASVKSIWVSKWDRSRYSTTHLTQNSQTGDPEREFFLVPFNIPHNPEDIVLNKGLNSEWIVILTALKPRRVKSSPERSWRGKERERGKKERINLIIMKKIICTSIVLLSLGLMRRIKVVAWRENPCLRQEVNWQKLNSGLKTQRRVKTYKKPSKKKKKIRLLFMTKRQN